MQSSFNNIVLAFSLLFYGLLWWCLEPSLGYLLDSDAVAYLTIAHRIAGGDYLKSINGLWSPMNSWLLVPFIKQGLDAWASAKALNCFFGGVLLIQSWMLFLQLGIDKKTRTIFMMVLPMILVYMVYFQMFGDVLQLVFALTYIQLLLRHDFLSNTKVVVLSGLIMGLGFYAKTYSAIFFITHLSSLVLYDSWRNKIRRRILLNYVFGVCVLLAVMLPRAIQLHQKYDTFSLMGNAGKLNLSWHINSGKTFRKSIKLLIPPPYEDSPSFWEDPFPSQGKLSTPFDSVQHFSRWVLRIIYNVFLTLKTYVEFSICTIPFLLFLFYRMRKRQPLSDATIKLILALLVLPLGYLAIVVEGRYLWLSIFLLLFLAGLYAPSQSFSISKKSLLISFFAISFLVFPAYKLWQLKGKNKELFLLAQELKALPKHSKIVTNMDDEGSFWVVCYLAQLSNYTIEKSHYTLKDLSEEMRRYNISYYFHVAGQGGDYIFSDSCHNPQFTPLVQHMGKEGSLWKLKN